MKVKGQKGEANVATFLLKVRKKNKGGKGNKIALPAAAQKGKKIKPTKEICFHYNQDEHWKRNCQKYSAKKKKAKEGN